jgi:pre-mRNA-processing factor 39
VSCSLFELVFCLVCSSTITNIVTRPKSVTTVAKGPGSQENGATAGELDEASKAKAEARGFTFFQLYSDPPADAQGTADFN